MKISSHLPTVRQPARRPGASQEPRVGGESFEPSGPGHPQPTLRPQPSEDPGPPGPSGWKRFQQAALKAGLVAGGAVAGGLFAVGAYTIGSSIGFLAIPIGLSVALASEEGSLMKKWGHMVTLGASAAVGGPLLGILAHAVAVGYGVVCAGDGAAGGLKLSHEMGQKQ